MLSPEQIQIINKELSKETASEFVRMLLFTYANTVDKAGELLEYIPKIANKQLQMKQEQVSRYSLAMDLMIADRHSHPGKYKENDSNGRFCTLFYTCKAHFLNGNAENDSIAGKSFFNEFIEMLKIKKEFNYMDVSDWDWIYSTAGGADWLESVIKQNIDTGFVKPKDKPFRSYRPI